MNQHLAGNSKRMEDGCDLRNFYSDSTRSESRSCSLGCVSNKDNFQQRYESNKVNGVCGELFFDYILWHMRFNYKVNKGLNLQNF